MRRAWAAVALVVALATGAPLAAGGVRVAIGDINGDGESSAYKLEGNTLTKLVSGPGCLSLVPGMVCVGDPSGLPLAYGTSPAATQLFLHPSSSASIVFGFTAPTTGIYQISYFAELADPNLAGNGVGVSEGLYDLASGPDLDPVALLLPAVQKIREAAARHSLAAGQTWLLAFDSNGHTDYDTIGLRIDIAAVPEPASWAMLIAGFGLTGAAMRRRRGAEIRA